MCVLSVFLCKCIFRTSQPALHNVSRRDPRSECQCELLLEVASRSSTRRRSPYDRHSNTRIVHRLLPFHLKWPGADLQVVPVIAAAAVSDAGDTQAGAPNSQYAESERTSNAADDSQPAEAEAAASASADDAGMVVAASSSSSLVVAADGVRPAYTFDAERVRVHSARLRACKTSRAASSSHTVDEYMRMPPERLVALLVEKDSVIKDLREERKVTRKRHHRSDNAEPKFSADCFNQLVPGTKAAKRNHAALVAAGNLSVSWHIALRGLASSYQNAAASIR